MARGDVVNPTQQVAIDYADEDVRVNSVSFGFVDTPMTEALLKTERFCAFLDRIGIHARPLEGEFHALDLLIRLDQRRRHRLDALGIGAPLGELHRRGIVRFQHVDDDPANRGLTRCWEWPRQKGACSSLYEQMGFETVVQYHPSNP